MGLRITNVDATKTTVTELGKGANTFSWIVEKGSCSLATSVTIINNQVTVEAGVKDTPSVTPLSQL